MAVFLILAQQTMKHDCLIKDQEVVNNSEKDSKYVMAFADVSNLVSYLSHSAICTLSSQSNLNPDREMCGKMLPLS